jgi:type IV pilus assembly protein PilB
LSLPPDFESRIVRQGIVSEDQLRDAADFASRSGKSVSDALLEMQYATAEQIAKVTADAYRLPYVEIQSAAIDQDVIELVPESIARENVILPVTETAHSLTIAISDPADLETIEKLRFILNRDIHTVVASHESIVSAINARYGEVEGESADSMLQEFTDTAIDFSETTIDFTETTDDRDIMYGEIEDDQYDDITANSLSAEPPAIASGIFGAVSYSLSMPSMFKRPTAPSPADRLVQLILKESIALRATHVILRPEYDAISVVYVIDGTELQRDRVSGRLKVSLVTRLKVLCKLDITAKNPLQSGRCPVTVNGRQQTCEVHFRETPEGTTVLIDFVSLPIDQTADPIKAWWSQP